jgi:hypothetical protein
MNDQRKTNGLMLSFSLNIKLLLLLLSRSSDREKMGQFASRK